MSTEYSQESARLIPLLWTKLKLYDSQMMMIQIQYFHSTQWKWYVIVIPANLQIQMHCNSFTLCFDKNSLGAWSSTRYVKILLFNTSSFVSCEMVSSSQFNFKRLPDISFWSNLFYIVSRKWFVLLDDVLIFLLVMTSCAQKWMLSFLTSLSSSIELKYFPVCQIKITFQFFICFICFHYSMFFFSFYCFTSNRGSDTFTSFTFTKNV